MLKLAFDILFDIITNLEDKSIKSLILSCSTFLRIFPNIKQKYLYWKTQTKNLFSEVSVEKNIKFDKKFENNINWYALYQILYVSICKPKPVYDLVVSNNYNALSVLLFMEKYKGQFFYDGNDIVTAVLNNCLEIVNLLLQCNTIHSIYFDFSIRLACDKGYTNIFKFLMDNDNVDLNSNIDLNINYLSLGILSDTHKNISRYATNHTLIQIAFYHEYEDIIALLINNYKVDISILPHDIVYKTYKKNMKIFTLLLQNNRFVKTIPYINDIMIDCLKTGRVEIALLLLQNHISKDKYIDNDIFLLASEKGYFEIIQLLLDYKRVDPCIYNNESIKLATENGHLDIVSLLLKIPKIKSDNLELTLFRLSIEYKQQHILKFLLCVEQKYPTNIYHTIFNYAAKHNNIDAITILLNDNEALDSDIKRYARRLANRKGYKTVMQILDKN
jgi:hypothetical protein